MTTKTKRSRKRMRVNSTPASPAGSFARLYGVLAGSSGVERQALSALIKEKTKAYASSTEEVRKLSLGAATRIALAEPGKGAGDEVSVALKMVEDAVKVALEGSFPVLKGETLVWRAFVRRTAAELLPERSFELLQGALTDVDDAMEQLKTAPKEEVAPARIERANVLLGLATTAGATLDPRVAESVEEYKRAVEAVLISESSDVPAITTEAPWVSEIRAIRENYDLNRPDFASLLGCSDRTLAKWEGGKEEPGRVAQRRYEELRRLHEGLATIMKIEAIPVWLRKKNAAFENQAPLDVIRQGRNDLLWQMIFHLQSSPSL